jgi:hypothetical protein
MKVKVYLEYFKLFYILLSVNWLHRVTKGLPLLTEGLFLNSNAGWIWVEIVMSDYAVDEEFWIKKCLKADECRDRGSAALDFSILNI